jgi:hypothetical protein
MPDVPVEPTPSVHEISEAFAVLAAATWRVSPERAFVGLSVTLESIALLLIAHHPDAHTAVLNRLRDLVACVEGGIGRAH